MIYLTSVFEIVMLVDVIIVYDILLIFTLNSIVVREGVGRRVGGEG